LLGHRFTFISASAQYLLSLRTITTCFHYLTKEWLWCSSCSTRYFHYYVIVDDVMRRRCFRKVLSCNQRGKTAGFPSPYLILDELLLYSGKVIAECIMREIWLLSTCLLMVYVFCSQHEWSSTPSENLLWYVAEHEIVYNCNMTTRAIYPPKKLKSLPRQSFRWMAWVLSLPNKSNTLCALLHVSLKDNRHCTANKLISTFDQRCNAVKHTVLCLLQVSVCLSVVVHTVWY